jgi:hypothetical protein
MVFKTKTLVPAGLDIALIGNKALESIPMEERIKRMADCWEKMQRHL